MSLLSKLRGNNTEKPAESSRDDIPACPHATLVPRWDGADDIGDHSKVTAWVCESCRATFSPSAAESLRATEAERLQNSLGTN